MIFPKMDKHFYTKIILLVRNEQAEATLKVLNPDIIKNVYRCSGWRKLCPQCAVAYYPNSKSDKLCEVCTDKLRSKPKSEGVKHE